MDDADDLFMSFRATDYETYVVRGSDSEDDAPQPENLVEDDDDEFFDADMDYGNGSPRRLMTSKDQSDSISESVDDITVVFRADSDNEICVTPRSTGDFVEHKADSKGKADLDINRTEPVLGAKLLPAHVNSGEKHREGSTKAAVVKSEVEKEEGDEQKESGMEANSKLETLSAMENKPTEGRLSATWNNTGGDLMKAGRFNPSLFLSAREHTTTHIGSPEGESPKKGTQMTATERELSKAEIDIISSTADSLGEKEIETEFTIKNLDTGEDFNVQDLDKVVPSGIDPIMLHVRKKLNKSEFSSGRSSTTSDDGSDDTDDGGSKKKRKFWKKKKKKKKSNEQSKVTKDDKLKASFEDYVKYNSHRKTAPEFADAYKIQTLSHHTGAVWCVKLNHTGTILATAGRDMVILLWKVVEKPADGFSPTLFEQKPYQMLYGHTSDVLSLSWSSNNLLLSSSLDKTVRLWHASRSDCLCTFQHVDSVTCAEFNPTNSNFFMSGSLDEKLRLWSIKEKTVVDWVETGDLITAGTFTKDGSTILTGSLKGYCNFYQTIGLQYVTQLHVHSRRGKNKKGKKITGIEIMPDGKQLLISSNDSRIRLYNHNDFSLQCKYKGHANHSSQLHASPSETGNIIISGSEDSLVYTWPISPSKSSRRDRNESYDSLECSDGCVTCAIFASSECAKLLNPKFTDTSVIIFSNARGVVSVLANDKERSEKLISEINGKS